MALCLLLQLAFTYLPIMHRLFGTARHRPDRLGDAGAAGLAVFGAIELEKAIARRMLRR